jgi:four helix bundle protein
MIEQEKLRLRTKRFAIGLVHLCRSLPRSEEARIIGRQLLRSGTGTAANYRSAGRARSRAEFLAKLGTVVEEADETVFWLELIEETGILPAAELSAMRRESEELLSIFSASLRTARRR